MTTIIHRYQNGAPAGAPRRLGWTGLAALLTVIALLAVATPLEAQRTIRASDLRCLTNKQDDCLPEPMSAEEPHKAICASCHNVWTQKTHAEAATTCASSGCHARPDTLTPFHRGLAVQVRRNCIGCHPAHDARIPEGGANCTFCHTAGGMSTAANRNPRPPARIVRVGRTPAQDRVFQHDQHTEVACTSCHTGTERHGSVELTQARDCQSCHHKVEQLASYNCQSCHQITRLRSSPARGVPVRTTRRTPAERAAARR